MRIKMSQLVAASAALALTAGSAQASTLLFADDFSNGSVGTPVGVNDPDPQGNPETIADNTSVSGTIPAGFGPDDRVWTGGVNGAYEEQGDLLEMSITGTSGRVGLQARSDTMDLAPHIIGGELSLIFEDVNPIVGGGGTSGNWFAWSLSNSGGGLGGSAVKFNDGDVPIGGLFRDSGLANVASAGATIAADVVYDAAPTDGTYDFRVNLTNIDATSFDYDVLVNGGSIDSGSVAGVDTSVLVLSLESTGTQPTTIGRVAVETAVPEPTSLALLGLGGLLFARRRRG